MFIDATYQDGKNIPDGHKSFQRAIKYAHTYTQYFPFQGPSKMYSNSDFWYANKNHLATLLSAR
jgi:hypothetical protein